MSRKFFMDTVLRQNSSGLRVFGTGASIVCKEPMDKVGVYFPYAHLDAEKMCALGTYNFEF